MHPRRRASSESKTLEALPALAVFARAPIPGKTKTRLIPVLGPRGAAEFHVALVSDVLQKVKALAPRVSPHFFLAGGRFPVPSFLSGFNLERQRGRTLGERLDRAFRRLLKRHACALVIGTDSPLLQIRHLQLALQELRSSDAVLGPCPDGGFYLLGTARFETGLLANIRWGSAWAFRDMRRNLAAHEFSCSVLESVPDVDRPADVHRLAEELERNSSARRSAPCTWRFLQDFLMIKAKAKNIPTKNQSGMARRG